MKMLQKYFYILIDIFFCIMDNKDDKSTLSELEAWLYFIGSDKPEDMEKIIHVYPKFIKMYEEINMFRKNPKEAVGMFSDALRIMDENTVKLMIEQQKEEIKAQAEIIEQNNVIIAEKEAEIADKNAEIARKLKKYKAAGVRGYGMVDPDKKKVVVYDWGKGEMPTVYGFDDKVSVENFHGECEIDFAKIYEQIQFLYGE